MAQRTAIVNELNGLKERGMTYAAVARTLASDFADLRAEFTFRGGNMSERVLAQIKRAITNTMQACVELSEPDALLSLSARTGAAYALA